MSYLQKNCELHDESGQSILACALQWKIEFRSSFLYCLPEEESW